MRMERATVVARWPILVAVTFSQSVVPKGSGPDEVSYRLGGSSCFLAFALFTGSYDCTAS